MARELRTSRPLPCCSCLKHCAALLQGSHGATPACVAPCSMASPGRFCRAMQGAHSRPWFLSDALPVLHKGPRAAPPGVQYCPCLREPCSVFVGFGLGQLVGRLTRTPPELRSIVMCAVAFSNVGELRCMVVWCCIHHLWAARSGGVERLRAHGALEALQHALAGRPRLRLGGLPAHPTSAESD